MKNTFLDLEHFNMLINRGVEYLRKLKPYKKCLQYNYRMTIQRRPSKQWPKRKKKLGNGVC